MRPFFLKALVWLIVLGVVAILVVRYYTGSDSEVRAWAGSFINFTQPPPKGAGHYLACPAGTCGSSADMESPVFPVSAERLHEIWVQTLGRDPRLRLVRQDADGLLLGYVQVSAVLALPDLISVQFVPEGNTRSSDKLFSEARYPEVDFGANRRRVEDWMHRLIQNFPDGMPLGG